MTAAHTAILDIDGTLVDTNYHHVVAWGRAFSQHDITLPLWRVHTHMGMGGDKLVEAVAGKEIEEEQGDSIRAAEKVLYAELIGEVKPLKDARKLVEFLSQQGQCVVLASSAKADEAEHYIDLLQARELADAWTTSADVEDTKPDPDLVKAALAKGAGGEATMLGDTPWDVEAAERAGISCVCVLTGGFSEQELREAGASHVYASLTQLLEYVDETPFGASPPSN